MVLQDGVYDWLMHKESITHQPIHKRIGIFIAGILPSAAIQPERLAARIRQGYPGINEIGRGKVGEKNAEFKRNEQEFSTLRVIHQTKFCLRSPHGETGLTLSLNMAVSGASCATSISFFQLVLQTRPHPLPDAICRLSHCADR